MEKIKYKIDETKHMFEREFGQIANKFDVIDLPIEIAKENGAKEVNMPGVYLFWHPEFGVVKVGKSQGNSKKRALEHIRDNTKNDQVEMAATGSDPNTRLILFNLVDKADMHWLLSLEAYFEWNVHPIIRSGRMG